ncbi:MAG: sigma-54-dependent transcriptional regulator [bacterium]
MIRNKIILCTSKIEPLELLKPSLQAKDFNIIMANDGEDAKNKIREFKPDLAIVDIHLPTINGIDFLQQIKKDNSKLPVIMVSGQISTNAAIEAMKLGAYDYIVPPFDIPRLVDIIKTAIEAASIKEKEIAINPSLLVADSIYDSNTIIGNSCEMLEIYKMIGQVAQSEAPVLIQGESGTGKELVARSIYYHSLRNNNIFLAVNCAAIPEHLLESELFGHEKGAFTGALSKKIGKFEQCSKGTIFLDEIGDMALSAQSKMLRVLQDQVFERVGGHESIKVDVRVIAATNKSLVNAVKEGSFRVDLFYRLKVISFYLPALRERREDIGLLADYFLLKYRRKLKKEINGIAHTAIMRLTEYDWPGNIRELENVIQSAIVLCKGDIILPEHLPIGKEDGLGKPKSIGDFKGEIEEDFTIMFEKILSPIFDKIDDPEKSDVPVRLLENMEKALIKLTLRKVNNNQVKASRMLDISRNTLRSKIEKYGIN